MKKSWRKYNLRAAPPSQSKRYSGRLDYKATMACSPASFMLLLLQKKIGVQLSVRMRKLIFQDYPTNFWWRWFWIWRKSDYLSFCRFISFSQILRKGTVNTSLDKSEQIIAGLNHTSESGSSSSACEPEPATAFFFLITYVFRRGCLPDLSWGFLFQKGSLACAKDRK